MAALSPRTRSVLLDAALLAQPTIETLERVAAHPERVRPALHAGAVAGVLELDGQRIAFAHPLMRSVARSSATDRRLRAAHLRLAGAADSTEERAQHLALAADGPDEDVAALLENTAHAAFLRGAHPAAGDLAEQALALTPADRVPDRLRRGQRAAEYRFKGLEPMRADEILGTIEAWAPSGPGRAALLHLRGIVQRHIGTAGSSIDLLRRAADEPGLDPSLRAAILLDLATAVAGSGDGTGALALATEGLALAELAGDRLTVAQLSAGIATVEFLNGGPFPAELIARALAGADVADDVPMEQRPRLIVAQTLRFADDFDGARALLEHEYRRAKDRGAETDLPIGAFSLIELELFGGRWDRAEAYAEEAAEVADAVATPATVMFATGIRSWVDALRGRISEAETDATRALELGERHGWFQGLLMAQHALAFLALSRGEPDEVDRRLGPLSTMLALIGIVEPSAARFVPDHVEALVALGELDRAETILAPFDAAAHGRGRLSAMATAARSRALLEGARGDPTSAAGFIERGLAAHDRLSHAVRTGPDATCGGRRSPPGSAEGRVPPIRAGGARDVRSARFAIVGGARATPPGGRGRSPALDGALRHRAARRGASRVRSTERRDRCRAVHEPTNGRIASLRDLPNAGDTLPSRAGPGTRSAALTALLTLKVCGFPGFRRRMSGLRSAVPHQRWNREP